MRHIVNQETLSPTFHFDTGWAQPSQKMDSPPSRHFKSVDSKIPPSIILSSDMREGGTRPDDLAVAIRAEGVRDAMMVVG